MAVVSARHVHGEERCRMEDRGYRCVSEPVAKQADQSVREVGLGV